jgi:hypothetical protein
MLISKQELFPTLIRKFQFNENEMSALLKEITNKKEEIKETSFFYSINHYENYYTDYKKPTQFASQGYTLELGRYWTAIYGKDSAHNSHNHHSLRANFSSILYLTDGGSTSLISSNHTSDQKEHFEMAEVGKLIIFPAAQWHYVTYKESNERIIISQNLRITGNEYV